MLIRILPFTAEISRAPAPSVRDESSSRMRWYGVSGSLLSVTVPSLPEGGTGRAGSSLGIVLEVLERLAFPTIAQIEL
jgi:hypothetical protein